MSPGIRPKDGDTRNLCAIAGGNVPAVSPPPLGKQGEDTCDLIAVLGSDVFKGSGRETRVGKAEVRGGELPPVADARLCFSEELVY